MTEPVQDSESGCCVSGSAVEQKRGPESSSHSRFLMFLLLFMCSLRFTRTSTTEWYSCWYSATLRPWINRSGASEEPLKSVSRPGEEIRGPMQHSGRTAAFWTNRGSSGSLKSPRLSCPCSACLVGCSFSLISRPGSSAHSRATLARVSHPGEEIWGLGQHSVRTAAFWMNGVTGGFLKTLRLSCSVSLFLFCCSVNLVCKTQRFKENTGQN